MTLESALIEIAALKSEREADKHMIRCLRGALQDIADENTGIEPALFAYAVLNPE